MKAYHRWGSHAQQSRLPPTPPEYQPEYLTPMSATSDDMHYYNGQGYRAQSSRDYHDRYQHVPAYVAQQSLAASSQPRMKMSQEYHYPQQVAPYHYATVPATVLPPIRVADDIKYYTHAHPEPKKEEKPTGGVAQHLDYEMETMASFVAEMAQRIVTQGNNPTPQFRKYVSQILSSTRLPSSTIMLGLFYLQERMKMVAARRQDTSSSSTVYRMLTTCLLLGSKFLDDNTFQNRSWAEVSSIPVQELNTMELDWLKDFNWEIHQIMNQHDGGLLQWIDHWHAYEDKAQQAKVKELHKLAPIETSISRHSPTMMSPDGPIPPQYQQGTRYDTQWARTFVSDYSPPSAPHSGPSTPNYYGTNYYAQAPPAYTRPAWNSGTSAYSAQRTQVPSYHTPYHSQAFSQSTWAGHGMNCGCTLCAKSDYYFSNSGYGLQTVVG